VSGQLRGNARRLASRSRRAATRERRLLGEGPEYAGRQAAVLLVLAGLLAIAALPNQPNEAASLLTIAAADLGLGAVAWLLPWERWGRYAPLSLVVPVLAILGLSTWVFGGFAAGTGPFFVLSFAWLGLHFPARVSYWVAGPALVAYLVPLAVTHQSRQVLSSAVVLLPIAVGVGWIVATQVAVIQRTREQVTAVERWRAALTSTLAHDVRSPLTTLRMTLHLLARSGSGLSAERRGTMLATAEKQTLRIQRLAESLLDADRVDTRGVLRLDRQVLYVQEAAREAVSFLESPAIRIDVPPDLRVYADRVRLEQVLVNLLGNALRHGGPPVVIAAARAGDQVTIEIRDHGPGIPADRQERLFTRFGSTEAGSVGLGLWIARELTRAHGGELIYHGADPGACFRLTLPAGPTD
jgi:signal transduction histidine kinase